VVVRKNRSSIKLDIKEEYDRFIDKYIHTPDEVLDGDYLKFELILKKMVLRTEKITLFIINCM